MLCIRANSSLSWFARRWRGAGFFFWSSGLRSARARGRAGFFFKLVLALVARDWFFLLVKWLALRAGQSALSLRLIVLFWCAKENLTSRNRVLPPRHRRVMPLKRKRATVPHGTLALSPHLCAAAVGMRTVYSMYPSRSSRCAVAGTPLSVIRRMAWSMVFTKMRTSFTIEMR